MASRCATRGFLCWMLLLCAGKWVTPEDDSLKQKTNITVLPSNSIRVYRGTTVTVTCLAKGWYMPSEYWYTWILGNKPVGFSPSMSLRVNDTFPTKTNLICSVFVRQQNLRNASVDLQVLGDPPPLNNTYHRNVGESLDLGRDCNPPCNCSWGKVTNHVDQNSSDKKPCNISITNKSQTGSYIVRRTNYLNVTIGEPREGISVDVIKIQVSDKPTIECPEQQYVIRTNSKEFKTHHMCRFQRPWNIRNCTGDTRPSCDNCSIQIDEIHNSGNYTCELGYFNKRLNQSNSKTFNISVHILKTNWTVRVMQGSNISLNSPNCSGAYSNNYTWKILGDDGKPGETSQLYNVPTSANYLGYSQKTANTLMKLEVLHEPEVTCYQKVSYALGTRVSLHCSVNAVPPSSYITWTRDNKVIRNTTSDTWDLGDIGMTDKGSYICTAYNTMVDDCSNETREGNGSCTITLDVYVEGDKRTVTVVASVLSLLLVCLMVVVGVLSGLLHVARREERRRNQPTTSCCFFTKMLPLLTTPEPVKGVPPSDIYQNA